MDRSGRRHFAGACLTLTGLLGWSLVAEGAASPSPVLSDEQIAKAEMFLRLKELSVSVQGADVTFSGRSVSGVVGDEFELKVAAPSSSVSPVGDTPGPLVRAEVFVVDGQVGALPFMMLGPLKIEAKDPGAGVLRIALIAEAKNQALNLIFRDSKGVPVGKVSELLLIISSPFSGAGAPQKNPPLEALQLPFPWWAAILLMAVLALLLGGVVFGVHRWSQRLRLSEPAPLVVPERPEDVAALDALAAIERQEWMKKNQYKPHFFGVSETLKRYLGRRFGVNALESTSGELVELLKSQSTMGEREILIVNRLFDRLDWVKFTDAVPAPQDGSEVLSTARQLVLQTRRRDHGGANP